MYRDISYDMALASCFSALFTSVHREAIESTAHHILALLPEAVLNTESSELKVSWAFVRGSSGRVMAKFGLRRC